MSDDPRRVHVTVVPIGGGRIEYVRYDRSGKWYREDGDRRTLIKIGDAVDVASSGRASVVWHEGLPGGWQFDAKVRRARQEKGT